MKTIYYIIYFMLYTRIFSKGGGKSSGGRSSGSRSSSQGSGSKRGSLRNSNIVRFKTREYGRSRLWFSNHYVNIHYVGHHNYYDESQYVEEDYYNINEDIYLIYVINGTFLRNHLKDSNYQITGHYITFSEYSALSDFLQNLTEFQNIFGNDTRIIMSTNYLMNNFINSTIVDFINEDSYQSIMIDVITDVHYVPFYKLFPKFNVDTFLIFLSYIFCIIFFFCTSCFYFKFIISWREEKNFSYIYILTLFLMGYFIIAIQKDIYLRKNYMLFLSRHFINSLFFALWQILQFYFCVYLLSFIIDIDYFSSITCIFYLILLSLEYLFEGEVGTFLKYIIFLKFLYFLYSIVLVNNHKENTFSIEKKDNKSNIIIIIFILMIIFELLDLVNNALIFYSIQFDFYLILAILLFFNNERKIDNQITDDKIEFLNKN